MIFLLLILACIAAPSASASRETVPFDYGWKATIGDAPGHEPTCTFSRDLTDQVCDISGNAGFKYTPQGRVWQSDCEKACVSWENCTAWAWVKSDWWASCYISLGETSVSCVPPQKSGEGNVRAGGSDRSCEQFEYIYQNPSYDDTDWNIVDVPHDSVINNTYSELEDNNHGSLLRNVTWYRKHFRLPSSWSSESVYLQFDGIFHIADIWVNGMYVGQYRSGYLPINIRLDNLSGIKFGENEENIVVIRADPSFGSGHWYEGGGIYRNCRLIKTGRVHIVPDGIYSSPAADGTDYTPSVKIINEKDHPIKKMIINFALYPFGAHEKDPISTSRLHNTVSVEPLSTVTITGHMSSDVKFWSEDEPVLYTLKTTIDVDGAVSDEVLTTVAFRSTKWDKDTGFYLNKKKLHFHGFCHHEDFTGVGVGVPDRINLYRAQAMRAVGGNSWRASHNPYSVGVYDILDRLGIVVWDEARDYTRWNVEDMASMVKRDRNHPSVIVWSFCNEIECHQDADDTETHKLFRLAAKENDPDRPVSANWVPESSNIVDLALDVHGMSHTMTSDFKTYHSQHPERPIVSSECCSCETQRGENNYKGGGGSVYFSSFDGECLKQQIPWSDDVSYVAGTMGVWTLFDYYGEPGGLPHVSSSFGQFDLAGIPKAHAYWYKIWWECAQQNEGLTSEKCVSVRIMQDWGGNHPPSVIDVVSNAYSVELLQDGKSLGAHHISEFGYVSFNVTFTPGELKALARDAQGNIVASHSVSTPSNATRVHLDIDSPSPRTGTGSVLVADGHDAALIRASIVDDQNRVVTSSNQMVNFRIVSGPARIIGVGNGDPSCQEPNQVPYRSAYNGIARAVIQANVDCASPHRQLMKHIDVHGDVRTKILNSHSPDAHVDSVIIEATVDGLLSGQIEIPLSCNLERDGPLAVAASRPSYDDFLDHFE